MRFVCLAAALCLGWAVEADAQRFIYDSKRDTTAQQAAAAAREVTSGTLFDTMLRNVDAQARLEADTVTAFVQEQMRAKLNAFRVWHDPNAQPQTPGQFSLERARLCPTSVDCVLRTLRQQHAAALAAPALSGPELEKRLEQIRAKRAELQKELKKLRDASKTTDPFVVRAFAVLEDPGADIVDYAQKAVEFAGSQIPGARGLGPALDAIESGLDQVLALYRAIEGIWRGQQAVSVDPVSLRPPPQEIDLQLLAVEQAHLKTRARIDARKHLEVGAALARVETALSRLEAAGVARSTERIEATLRSAAAAHNRDSLLALLMALHEAASAVAQVDAANALAELRLTDEERRYSIRRSAVNASTYDETIQAAVQRLALYWKGGIKASELAQFVFYVTNTIALPAIAIKQE